MDFAKLQTIPIRALQFESHNGHPGYLLGAMKIAGQSYHVEAVRVEEDAEGCLVSPDGDDTSNEERLNDLCRLCGDGDWGTIEIPGETGRWVVYMTPMS